MSWIPSSLRPKRNSVSYEKSFIQRARCQIIYQPKNYRNILYNIKRISSTNQYQNIKLGLELLTAHNAQPKIQAMKLTMLEEPYRNLMPFCLGFIGLVIGGILTTFLLGQRLKINTRMRTPILRNILTKT